MTVPITIHQQLRKDMPTQQNKEDKQKIEAKSREGRRGDMKVRRGIDTQKRKHENIYNSRIKSGKIQ